MPAVQAALRQDGLDGWLLYDFHGQNPIAASIVGGQVPGMLGTRRWYYLIPSQGTPRGLVHAIEPGALAQVPGQVERYAGRQQLLEGLGRLLSGLRQVAMEYSADGAIPYVGRVDAGTVELIRKHGIEVVTSGDLAQRFSAVWQPPQIASHRRASEKLHRIKDQAFEMAARAVRDGVRCTEWEVQQAMTRWFAEERIISDSPPNVSMATNSGNPHYLPTAEAHQPLAPEQVVLLDLWGKEDAPGSVYADITWVGYTGVHTPARVTAAFAAVAAARDAAVDLVQARARAGQDLRGWEVDRAAAALLVAAGYQDAILHRTGHSLGESVHGNGVNMDDYETHDDRRLLAGTGFTIEPGVYFADFGIRSEINMVMGDRDAVVTGPRQAQILALV